MKSGRCLPALFSTPHPDGLVERVLPAYELPEPLRRELHRAGPALGRVAALGTRYEGQRDVAAAQEERWISFLRAWIEHGQPL